MTNQCTRGYLLAFVGIAGIALILISTPWGIGVSHDSVYYLNSAENMLAGAGLQWQAEDGELRPLTHYPPLYPVVLVGAGSIGLDLVEAARILAALLFGANLIVLVWLIHRHVRSRWAAWAAFSLALISPVLLDVHLMALTEPLFMFFLLISIASIMEFLDRSRVRWLYLAGIFSALASLTRYAGLSLTATGVLVLIFLWRDDRRAKIVHIGLYLFISLAPIVGWNVRNQLLAGTTVGRDPMLHTVPAAKLQTGAATLLRWLLPEEVPFWIGVVILFFCAFGFGIIVWRGFTSSKRRLGDWVDQAHIRMGGVSGLYVLVYGVFLIVSLTFVDASTPLDVRILAPAYLMAFIATLVILGGVEWGGSKPRLRTGLLAAAWIAMLLSYGWSSTGILKTTLEEGRGFTAKEWSTSELIVKVDEMNEAAIIYSSDALRLSFLTGRTVYGIPQKLNPIQGTEIESYQDDLARMRGQLQQPGAALVLFADSFALYRPELPKIEEVTEGLELFWTTRHGVIYIDPMSVEP